MRKWRKETSVKVSDIDNVKSKYTDLPLKHHLFPNTHSFRDKFGHFVKVVSGFLSDFKKSKDKSYLGTLF